MPQLIINPYLDNLDECLAFAEENDCLFEITGLCYPSVIDDAAKVREHIRIFSTFKDKIYSMHGAWIGLQIATRDMAVRQVSRNRIIQNCENAAELGIGRIIIHGDKPPGINTQSGTDYWVNTAHEFYTEIIAKFGINIIIENCWDYEPYAIKQLIDKMNTPKFKACLDTGHVNCFAKSPLDDWIDILGEDITHIHLCDNLGTYDDDLPAGQGTFDFDILTKRLEQDKIEPAVVFELPSLERVKASVEYLKANGLFPYNK